MSAKNLKLLNCYSRSDWQIMNMLMWNHPFTCICTCLAISESTSKWLFASFTRKYWEEKLRHIRCEFRLEINTRFWNKNIYLSLHKTFERLHWCLLAFQCLIFFKNLHCRLKTVFLMINSNADINYSRFASLKFGAFYFILLRISL